MWNYFISSPRVNVKRLVNIDIWTWIGNEPTSIQTEHFIACLLASKLTNDPFFGILFWHTVSIYFASKHHEYHVKHWTCLHFGLHYCLFVPTYRWFSVAFQISAYKQHNNFTSLLWFHTKFICNYSFVKIVALHKHLNLS